MVGYSENFPFLSICPLHTQGQPWPLALGSRFLPSPTDPGPDGLRDLASPTNPGPAGPRDWWPCRARSGPDVVLVRNALVLLREKSDKFNGVVDGWDLIHAALAAVRELPADSWVTSFKRVNLHPKYRTSFVEWCKKIDRYLVGGQSFESETELDMYSLLPSFWHGMTPAEKKKAVSIFDKHGDCTLRTRNGTRNER